MPDLTLFIDDGGARAVLAGATEARPALPALPSLAALAALLETL